MKHQIKGDASVPRESLSRPQNGDRDDMSTVSFSVVAAAAAIRFPFRINGLRIVSLERDRRRNGCFSMAKNKQERFYSVPFIVALLFLLSLDLSLALPSSGLVPSADWFPFFRLSLYVEGGTKYFLKMASSIVDHHIVVVILLHLDYGLVHRFGGRR